MLVIIYVFYFHSSNLEQFFKKSDFLVKFLFSYLKKTTYS